MTESPARLAEQTVAAGAHDCRMCGKLYPPADATDAERHAWAIRVAAAHFGRRRAARTDPANLERAREGRG